MSVMTLTLRNATAIIDHHPTGRPATQRYTRTWHHASQLNPGDLWRPDPDQPPHTVTEVHRTRVWNGPDQITLIDQYAHPLQLPLRRTRAHRDPRPTDRPHPLRP